MLYCPSTSFDHSRAPDEMLFLSEVTANELARGLKGFAAAYKRCGVEVVVVDPSLVNDKQTPNAVFQRDVAWVTPVGAVIGRMAAEARAGEERAAAACLTRAGTPVAMTVRGEATLEGADLLWLRPRLVMCGVGKRTNEAGYSQVRSLLASHDIRAVGVPVPARTQHLLGAVQIVSATRAFVRSEIVSEKLGTELRAAGYEVVDVPESPEVRDAFAFNLVAIGPDAVITQDSSDFRRFLESRGVEVAAQVDARYHARAGGGLACATCVVERELVGGDWNGWA